MLLSKTANEALSFYASIKGIFMFTRDLILQYDELTIRRLSRAVCVNDNQRYTALYQYYD